MIDEWVAPDMIDLLGAAAAGPTHELLTVRLATTCADDTAQAISDAVTQLVRAFHDQNDVSPHAVRAAIFTATGDLRATKPASAARAAGWGHASMLCLAEMPTADDVPRCLRVLLFVRRGLGANVLVPVYLNGTESLRPDLFPRR
jgi:chorismate mutase